VLDFGVIDASADFAAAEARVGISLARGHETETSSDRLAGAEVQRA
jgi:hypothetical protein